MLDIYRFRSDVQGPHLLMLGAIHGDEICGAIALKKIVSEFQSGKVQLQRGQVTIVPICNPKAYEQNVRYVERNLNRYMSPIENPNVYEDHLTNELCPLLEDADILLDIHSYQAGGVPFAFIQGVDSDEVPFAKAIGVEHMVYGFANAYQNAVAQTPESREKARMESMGTTEYMRQFGGVGFTLECGKNGSGESIEFAEFAVRNALAHFGIVDVCPIQEVDPQIIEIQKVYYRERNEEFVCDRFNFAALSEGTVITALEDTQHVVADRDVTIVLPDPNSPVGDEWFYLGRQVN